MSPNRITFRRFIIATTFIGAQYATAQDIRDGLIHNTRGISVVAVRSEAKESIGTFTGMSNQIFKPQGSGPFPAVVLVHTCGGIDQAGHMRTHGQEMLSAGYVVFMLDSFGPRGIRNCRSPVTPSSFGALDAYAALEYLDSLPFVDKTRIFQAGYSWGGVVASFLASPQSSEVWKSKLRFRATVANYSPCSVEWQGKFAPLVVRDIDRPLLLLLAESDTETPISSCFPLVEEMKQAGAPLQWHIFPGATHGWDSQGMPRNGYVYNKETSLDATRRMLDFFALQK